ncbi:protein of unknown function nitrogen fixation [Rivularia sp. IAM M-261]|nr:protein of unknown function nitrogen fixation [Calothrix sp. PCC 7716]GJD18355.1 protein of unknown function nitrogen fixation [Rivularia sp. IAM M-261]
MSIENVNAFYERLANDEVFRTQMQSAKSKDESNTILSDNGYEFTQEEFEEVTANLLESTKDDANLRDLNEKELEAVFGGAIKLINFPFPVLLYGSIIDFFTIE